MKAANYALALASASGAAVIGLCVLQIPEYIEEGTRDILRRELTGKSRRTLGEIRELASKFGVDFSSNIEETSGAIATAICNFSTKNGVNLIVLGTRASTSSLTKMMLGSVASGVASNADCPVLVVR